MTVQSHVDRHIDITAALARLYLFLAQSIDRSVSERTQIDYPEAELQAHLVSTRAAVLDMLAGNQVVRTKVEQECEERTLRRSGELFGEMVRINAINDELVYRYAPELLETLFPG